MGRLLISKGSVQNNKAQKAIQKEYLKVHHKVRARYPKAKLGKVIERRSEVYIDCTKTDMQSKEKTITPSNTLDSTSRMNIKAYSIEEMISVIRKADIHGLSGSGFPTIKKIETVRASKAQDKYLIVNAVACDPGLIHDEWILREYQSEIKESIEALNKIINFKQVIIASPDNVPCKYPVGAEKILIKQLLGTQIPSEVIPAERGYLVLNVQTLYAIYKALNMEESMSSRYITLANIEKGVGYVAKVDIGETIEEMLERLRTKENIKQYNMLSFEPIPDLIFGGGGIMDAEAMKLEDKISEKINFIGFGEPAEFDDTARCKGCGACTRKCPEGVKVHKIIRALAKGETTDLERYGISKCISCGTCSYYCRAGKNTMGIIQRLRG